MNLSLPTVVVFGIGAILVYSSIKNKDPRDVVRGALGQKTSDKGFVMPKGGGGGGNFGSGGDSGGGFNMPKGGGGGGNFGTSQTGPVTSV